MLLTVSLCRVSADEASKLSNQQSRRGGLPLGMCLASLCALLCCAFLLKAAVSESCPSRPLLALLPLPMPTIQHHSLVMQTEILWAVMALSVSLLVRLFLPSQGSIVERHVALTPMIVPIRLSLSLVRQALTCFWLQKVCQA